MISAIVLAGGRGKRMNQPVSKQFINLKGKPILYYTLKKFIDNEKIDKIILVLPKDEINFCKTQILDKYNLKVDKIVEGGKERQDSVFNGLKAIEESDIVLIHDGARPFVSNRIIEEGIKYANIYGAAAPGVMPKDTIKIKDSKNFSADTPNRNTLVSVQTPQVFKYEYILEGHEKIKKENISVTDDTMVMELLGRRVYLYNGEYTKIKITTPEDLTLGENFV